MGRLEIGDAVPRRGNWLSSLLARALFRIFGWRFGGSFPNVGKAILLVAPHTSNWDFLVGVTTVFALGIRTSFLGKHTLFCWPLRSLMRWIGGISVDRSGANGVVEQVVQRFNESPTLLLGMSPEGTRRKVERWRTGFYHMARQAGVPIVPAAFDYATKTVRFGPPLMASGDLDADLAILQGFFSHAVGRRRENALEALTAAGVLPLDAECPGKG